MKSYERPRPTVWGTNVVLGPMGGIVIVRNKAMNQGWNIPIEVADAEYPDGAHEALAEADVETLDRLGTRHIKEL